MVEPGPHAVETVRHPLGGGARGGLPGRLPVRLDLVVRPRLPRDRRLDPLWIQAPPDLQIHTYGIPGRSPVLLEWARPTDEPWRAPLIPDPLPRNGRWLRTVGWSADAITATLQNWVAIHTGRVDVRFRWDPTSAPSRFVDLVRIEASADRPTADRDDVYQVGPGVYATGAMFDLLLALEPADAARVSASLARV